MNSTIEELQQLHQTPSAVLERDDLIRQAIAAAKARKANGGSTPTTASSRPAAVVDEGPPVGARGRFGGQPNKPSQAPPPEEMEEQEERGEDELVGGIAEEDEVAPPPRPKRATKAASVGELLTEAMVQQGDTQEVVLVLGEVELVFDCLFVEENAEWLWCVIPKDGTQAKIKPMTSLVLRVGGRELKAMNIGGALLLPGAAFRIYCFAVESQEQAG